MRQRIASLVFVLATVLLGASVAGAYWQSRQQISVGAGGGGGCSEATAFLARVSSPSGADTTNYTALICGMVSAGVYTSSWGFLYILAAKDTATALLDLSSAARDGTAGTAPPTWTAYQGASGTDALTSTMWIDSTYNASTTGPCTSTDCSFMVWSNTNINDNGATGGHGGGAYNGTAGYTGITMRAGNQTGFRINDPASGASALISSSTAAGFWVASRVSGTNRGYLNAVDQSISTNSAAAIPNYITKCLSVQDITAGQSRYGTNNQLSLCGHGRGFTGAEITSLYSLFGAYRSAVGL